METYAIFTLDHLPAPQLALVEKARVFAMIAHESVGQRRKYTEELYIIHPMEVAFMRFERGNWTLDDLIALILHDVVEDTPITLAMIAAEFGQNVANLVDGMTDRSRPEDGVRKVRKAIDNAHLLTQTNQVKANKMCDVNHNVKNIAQHDPRGFARKYVPEKKTQLVDGNCRDADPEFYDEIILWIDNWMMDYNVKWEPSPANWLDLVKAPAAT